MFYLDLKAVLLPCYFTLLNTGTNMVPSAGKLICFF